VRETLASLFEEEHRYRREGRRGHRASTPEGRASGRGHPVAVESILERL